MHIDKPVSCFNDAGELLVTQVMFLFHTVIICANAGVTLQVWISRSLDNYKFNEMIIRAVCTQGHPYHCDDFDGRWSTYSRKYILGQ